MPNGAAITVEIEVQIWCEYVVNINQNGAKIFQI
jgi:hypothetical protein